MAEVDGLGRRRARRRYRSSDQALRSGRLYAHLNHSTYANLIQGLERILCEDLLIEVVLEELTRARHG